MEVFAIGDRVWLASAGRTERRVMCPDCLGTGKLTVIMGDGAHVGIECENCKQGCLGCRGTIAEWDWRASVEEFAIDEVRLSKDAVEYYLEIPFSSSRRVGHDTDTFRTKAEAEKRSEELRAEHEKEEADKMQRKHKPHWTWAHNASYHRKQVKQLTKDLEYHKAKLEVAKGKTKEAKALDAKGV